MGIAAGVGAHRPTPRPLRCLRACTRSTDVSPKRPTFRLLSEPTAAAAAPHRRTRRETVNPTDLGPACPGEAGSGRKVIRTSSPGRLVRAGSPGAFRSAAAYGPVPDYRALSHPPGCQPSFRLLERRVGARIRCGWSAVSGWSARTGPEDSRAEPLLRGRLLGKGRLLEPKPPYRQNARLRGGI